MKRARRTPVLVAALLWPGLAFAQIPVPTPVPQPPPPAEEPVPETAAAIAPGAIEIQLGVAGITLPESSRGTYSAQPELRLGFFLHEYMELQGELSVRVWPLGTVAANSYGVSGNVLFFIDPPTSRARLFLLGGGGGQFADPPGPAEGRSFDPLVRGGIGVRVSLAGTGVSLLQPLSFAAEYRGELVFADDTDFVSGISLGVSRFL